MAFEKLSIELNGMISNFLDDRDLCAFSSTCRSTRDAVNCSSSSVWRNQFGKYFDIPRGVDNDGLKAIYQFRKRVLRRGAHFRDGRSAGEKECLQVLKDLVLQSYGSHKVKVDEHGKPMSENLLALEKFVTNHDILRNVLTPRYAGKTEPLLLVLQVLMAHLQLDLEVYSPTFGFPDSQKAVYATTMNEPIFGSTNKTEVNMEFVAHTVNMFKYHMTRREEQTLYDEYRNLPSSDRIQPWDKELQKGARKLGRGWKGIFTYVELEDLTVLRQPNIDDAIVLDNFNDDQEPDVFQTLDLEFLDKPHPWPSLFEHHLQSRYHPSASSITPPSKTSTQDNPATPRTRAQLRHSPTTNAGKAPVNEIIDPKPLSFQFVGIGVDSDPFLVSGWLTPLSPQHGIPGWQRWTMMKFYVPNGQEEVIQSADDPPMMKKLLGQAALAATDHRGLWAYEGVVLPGGKIVVGRWWAPQEPGMEDGEVYSGPFMFWCVNEEVAGV